MAKVAGDHPRGTFETAQLVSDDLARATASAHFILPDDADEMVSNHPS